jgi:hypothetical protein
MGCRNYLNNVMTTPQAGGANFNTAYPMRGFILVSTPALAPLPQVWPFTAFGYGSAGSPGSSCSDIFQNNAAARSASGTYFITVQGATIPVYCDMLPGSGGWTLVAMLASSLTDTTWISTQLGASSSSAWVQMTEINPTVTDVFANVNMKNSAYSNLALNSVRFVFGPPLNNQGFIVSATATSTLALMTGGTVTTSFARNDFLNAMSARFGPVVNSNYAAAPNCNVQGLSSVSPSSYCRFGLAVNNEADCATSDAWYACVSVRACVWGCVLGGSCVCVCVCVS